MGIRLISGSVYVLILACAYLMKIFINDLCFDALIYAFALIGAFEMLRATKEKTTKAERGLSYAFAITSIPVCALGEYFFGAGLLWTAIAFFVFSAALLSLLVIRHEETTLEGLGVAFLSAVYPSLLLCLMSLCNHLPGSERFQEFAINGDLAILFIFVISPVADSLAYVFGRFLKKYIPKKLAPNLSPNKTVIGFIGGLVGGLLGGLVLYFAYNALAGSFENVAFILPFYLLTGILLAAVTAFGDLVESCVKRKVNIKDMGKIMPGHGGVLDRIDGSLFAAFIVYFLFVILYLF